MQVPRYFPSQDPAISRRNRVVAGNYIINPPYKQIAIAGCKRGIERVPRHERPRLIQIEHLTRRKGTVINPHIVNVSRE